MAKNEKEKASDAFGEKFSATPSKTEEAERFRTADDALKALTETEVAMIAACGEDAPSCFVPVLESWCLLLEETSSVKRCAELAGDPSEFKLVGASTFDYLEPGDVTGIQRRIAGVMPAVIREAPHEASEAVAVMLEWLHAGLALHMWAKEERQKHT
uniref:Uncharacterized protein n=1 Tax=Noctiluca scintillans TaxID=2966 RepID=A0A7S1FBU4_NOCSC|mmetsp:Transcript_48156/g.127517  ORF Transcript_48156/g.127517 Transcript_48156/m.127517 type:complete len:157 (+) Transcript_48156:45-515(+)|eukprot:CAMPEP_0194489394 /NCGR_PEP_ID=MMETSP0253-20130528/8952_1 /TAXON_ID=2966 /ORGANISM="Noctiluca scintillans" /LENGTH=156 /DNA_ID=CAMNT_0039329849 /DNA_START=42 /DNA_END=512 /DNA_ORIENTATION=-